jgi:hypothetical protein
MSAIDSRRGMGPEPNATSSIASPVEMLASAS